MLKRSLNLATLTLLAFTLLGAATPDTRFDQLGHKLMCTCGCSEILLECNHVGCPDSARLIAALHRQVESGSSDQAILTYFAATYGPIVLAAPFRGGLFDSAAWVVPFAVLLAGLLGIVLLVRLWQRRHARLLAASPTPPAPPTPAETALRDRIRSETDYSN